MANKMKETDNFLAIAVNAEGVVRMAAPRAILAAGLAVVQAEHDAAIAGDKPATAVRETLDTFGAALKAQGAGKGEVSTKRKQAKQVATHIVERFGSDVLTAYADETDTVEACFAQAYADGVKSVGKLLDYMIHGDAEYTDKAKAAAKAEKDAEKEEAANARLANLAGMDVPAMNLGEPTMPEKVQNFEPVAEAEAEPAKHNLEMMVTNMDDDELAKLIELATAERDARLAETETADVA